MKKFGNMLWGIVLITIGLIIGLNALNITNIDIFFDGWWTLFIIIPCFIGLFKENEKIGNIIGLLIGVGLLLGCLDIIDFGLIWKLILPTILVIIGLSIIFKDVFGGKINSEIKKLNGKMDDGKSYCATFSGQDINFNGESFKGATLNAIFGAVKCDLRGATIESDVVINASCTFGGIDIYVPSNVKVKVKSTSLFGGIENKAHLNQEDNSYTIYINGKVLFGGIEIK